MASGTIANVFPVFGSDTHGKWIKFPNGVLIQWGITSVTFNNSTKADTTVTTGVTFIDNPSCFGAAQSSGVAGYVLRVGVNGAVNSNSISITAVYPDGAVSATRNVNWLAIGSWK